MMCITCTGACPGYNTLQHTTAPGDIADGSTVCIINI